MAEVFEIGPNSWRVLDDFVNYYMIRTGRHMLFLDSGASGDDLKALAANYGADDFTLLATHADGDHLAGADQCPTYCLHPADFPRAKGCVHRAVPLPAEDGAVLEFPGDPDTPPRQIEVLHVGGHTPGSVAYLDRETRFLYSGDVVQRNDALFLFGEGRDITKLIPGLENLYARRGEYDQIFPGHGDVPLTAEDIPPVIQACRKYLSGELTPEPPLQPMPCHLYRDGEVLLYL